MRCSSVIGMLDAIIAFSLKHRTFVLLTSIAVFIYGCFVISNLPVDVFPDLNRPTVTVMSECPGMAPEEVETLVTLPLEIVLNGLPQVERIRSTSGIGLSILYIEFSWDSEIYRNRQLVAEKLALAKEKLPKNISPIMGPIASIMGEIQLIGLSLYVGASAQPSTLALDLRTLADWVIRPRLLGIPGIAQVISIGGGVKQYQILISAEKLQHHRLSLEEVQHNLSHLSENTTGGFIDLNQKEYLIRNIGLVRSEEDLAQTVVGMHLGKPILVKDIAHIHIGSQIKRGEGSVNGQPAVIMSIQKQPGANTIELTRKIDLALSEVEKTLPKGVQLQRNLFKQAHFIETAIANVKEALRDGTLFIIVVLVIFLMNFRTTAITLTAIPLSFVI